MSAAKKEHFVKMLWNLQSGKDLSHNMLQRIVKILEWGEAEKIVLDCGVTKIDGGFSTFFH